MADIGDKAADVEQLERESQIYLASRQVKGLACMGACHFCSEKLEAPMKFCDLDCSQGWEREQAARRRNGSGGDD